MKRMHAIAAATLAAASLGLVAVSEAQMMGPGYGPGYGPGVGRGPGMMGGGPGFFGPNANGVRNPAANVEARLSALHTQLNITAAQETAWQAYANAVTQQAQQMTTFHNQLVQQGTLTAPERLNLMVQHMQQGATSMGNVATALDALYGQLSTDQRAILDQQWGPGMMRGGRWGQ